MKTAKTGGLCEDLLSENDFEAILVTFPCYDYGTNVSGAVRRSLQIRKMIRNAPPVLYFAE